MSEALLSVTGLYAGYGGGDVLRGVTLDVPAREITCVVGPNGAGKSTLMAVLCGLLKPSGGDVVFRGASLAGCRPREVLRRGIVHVPQNHSLFPDMTVRENVEMGAFIVRDRGEVSRRLAAVAELFPIVARRSGDKAGALSGGQRRLVEFARCLMLRPDLVLLDEPSMGLSPRVLADVFAAVTAMNAAGTTVLLVEQNARAGLRLAHQGVVMEGGVVRMAGPGAGILADPQIAALYLGGHVS
jgi:branched-chain amino acid transport system ATP-binding protein